jgi:hypothetical protein
MKKLLPFVIAALVIPSVALAKGKPPTAGTHTNQGKAKVQYILKGTLSAYSAFAAPSTNGSITIDVTRANRHGRALKGMSLTFAGMVTSSTRIVLRDGVTLIADGDRGIVKVRAPKEPRDMSGSDLAAVLTALPVRHIVDQGSAS